MSAAPEKQAWSGRFAFLMATVGSAVGLGSIWKFPYMVGANGGSVFLFAYLAGLVVLILPLMIGEFVDRPARRQERRRQHRQGRPRQRRDARWAAVGGWASLQAS